jgi:hypothetical protein
MDELADAERIFSALESTGNIAVIAFSPSANSASSGTGAVACKATPIQSLRKFDSSVYMDDSSMTQEMRSMRATSEKIMQQNIALLADVEAMTEQLTRMRNEKAILASQIVRMSK